MWLILASNRYTYFKQKTLSERTANGSCRTGDCLTKSNCSFHIWFAKTMSSSRGAKLILPQKRPPDSGLTPFTVNLEILRSTVLSQTHRKIKPLPLNAEEYGQTLWLGIEGRHFMDINNIQCPHFFSVVQPPFDNWHSSSPPTTLFEIGVFVRYVHI